MSRKKRVAWKPLKITYETIGKKKQAMYDKEEFDRICEEISHHQAVMHLLLTRLIYDIEIINDDMIHLGAKNDDVVLAYNNAIKWVGRSVDLVEPNMTKEMKDALLNDTLVLNNALDWYVGHHIIEMNDHKSNDIAYRARFCPHKTFYTKEENQAFLIGFVAGAESELDQKMEFKISVGDENIYITQEDFVKWFSDYCNKLGRLPEGLNYKTDKRQINE